MARQSDQERRQEGEPIAQKIDFLQVDQPFLVGNVQIHIMMKRDAEFFFFGQVFPNGLHLGHPNARIRLKKSRPQINRFHFPEEFKSLNQLLNGVAGQPKELDAAVADLVFPQPARHFQNFRIRHVFIQDLKSLFFVAGFIRDADGLCPRSCHELDVFFPDSFAPSPASVEWFGDPLLIQTQKFPKPLIVHPQHFIDK